MKPGGIAAGAVALLLASCTAAAPKPVTTLPPIAPVPSLADWTSLDWGPDASMPHGAAGGYFQVGAWNGGIVVTSQGLGGDEGAWTSRDGLAWTKAPSDPAIKGVTVESYAQSPGGLIAIGTTDSLSLCGVPTTPCPAPTSQIWSSLDGAHWQRRADPPFAHERVGEAFGDGRLLIVPASDGSRIQLWSSTDGISWSSASVPAVDFTGIAVVGGRYVVTGYVRNTALAPGRQPIVLVSTKVTEVVAAWSSTDGLTWTQIDGYQGPDIIIAGRWGDWGVTASGPCADHGKWWHSSDGSHWDVDPGNGPYGALDAEGLLGGCSSPRVSAQGGRLAALRSVPGGACTIWMSDGDANWRVIPATGSEPANIRTLTVVPGGVIANTDDGIDFAWGS
jgi:hypothetical protein